MHEKGLWILIAQEYETDWLRVKGLETAYSVSFLTSQITSFMTQDKLLQYSMPQFS